MKDRCNVESDLVSFVSPVFNDDVVLERAVRSVFARAKSAGEVIVVDDASNPPAAAAIRRICDAFSSVRFIVNSKNLGTAAALESALRPRENLLSRSWTPTTNGFPQAGGSDWRDA